MLGQQVSVAAARTFAGRLVAAYGMIGPGRLMMFPRPDVLRDADPEELRAVVGLTGARARTVQAVAAAFADRATLRPLSRSELVALPGIGPWTADYLAVTSGDRDAFTPGDLVLRRALGGVDARAASARVRAMATLPRLCLISSLGCECLHSASLRSRCSVACLRESLAPGKISRLRFTRLHFLCIGEPEPYV